MELGSLFTPQVVGVRSWPVPQGAAARAGLRLKSGFIFGGYGVGASVKGTSCACAVGGRSPNMAGPSVPGTEKARRGDPGKSLEKDRVVRAPIIRARGSCAFLHRAIATVCEGGAEPSPARGKQPGDAGRGPEQPSSSGTRQTGVPALDFGQHSRVRSE